MKKKKSVLVIDDEPDLCALIKLVNNYIIMMTADVNPGIQLQAKKEGTDDFFRKPFTMKQITEMARRVA